VSLFTPLIAGLYWKRATNQGAIVSMVAGMAVWLVTNALLPELAESGTLSGTMQLLAEIPPILYGLGASIAGMLVGSWLSAPKEVLWQHG
jgi:Na+/proline symporter